MKKCTNCRVESDNFSIDKSKKNGFRSWCKKCMSESSRAYKKTKKGIVAKIYDSQCSNSKKRGHAMPNYTKKQLQDFVFKQESFEKLYQSWVKSGYKKMLVPSCDRLDDCNPYTLCNIQLITWQENKLKCEEDMRSGKLIQKKNPHKPVTQLDLEGKKIAEFISIKEATRRTGVHSGNISQVCNKKRPTAGGFKWEFKS